MQHLIYSTKALGEVEISIQGAQPAVWGHIVNFQLTRKALKPGQEAKALVKGRSSVMSLRHVDLPASPRRGIK